MPTLRLLTALACLLPLQAVGCVDPASAPDAAADEGGLARCVPGRSEPCACAGGASGVQVCAASGSFDACECSLPDAGRLDAGSPDDRGTTPAMDGDAPVTTDAPGDATHVDAPAAPDRSDVAVSDGAAPDASAPDAPTGDVAPSVAAEETRLPWRSGSCALWSRVPPAHEYLGPIVTDEGLWAASRIDGNLMRRDAAGWTMVRFPPEVATNRERYRGLLAGTGWFAIVLNSRILLRRGGRWIDLASTGAAPAGIIYAVWTTGTHLMVAADGGYLDYDGTTTRRISGAFPPAGRLTAVFGDAGSLYTITSDSLTWFDAGRATVVPQPSASEIFDVRGTASDDVFALGAHLYHLDGATLRRLPDVDCGGPTPVYNRLVSAPGRLALVATCGTEMRAWNRVGGAWVALGPLPGPSAAQRNLAISEGGALAVSAGGAFWRWESGAWTPVPIETPGPPTDVLAARSPTDAYALGAGRVAHLEGDRWVDVAVPADLGSVTRAWLAPDGVLFAIALLPAGGGAIWRRAGGAWTRDAVTLPAPWSDFAGRASNDVYVAAGLSEQGRSTIRLLHWNGSTWSAVAAPPCTSFGSANMGTAHSLVDVALVGRRTLLASCYSEVAGASALQSDDGGPWTTGLTAYALRLFQLGPASTPAALAISGTRPSGTYHLRTEGGWAPWDFRIPMGSRAIELVRGSTLTRVVAIERESVNGQTAGVGRGDGAAWTSTVNWVTTLPLATPGGTDGRWVFLRAAYGGQLPAANAIVRCDLGP